MLELAASEPGQALALGVVAERQAVSRKYLQHLMSELRRAGLVRAVRGFRGGYMLAKPADAIRLGDILRALEGDLGLAECVRDAAACDRMLQCPTYGVWSEASRVLEDYFDSLTLADVLDGKR